MCDYDDEILQMIEFSFTYFLLNIHVWIAQIAYVLSKFYENTSSWASK